MFFVEASKVDPSLFGSDLPLSLSKAHGSARFEKFGLVPEDELLKEDIWKAVFFGCCEHEGKKHYHAASPKRHFLTVAPTRSGKGVSVIIPNLLRYRGNCIVIDPKGENAWLTAKYRREGMKQKTIILDPWGEINRRYGAAAGELETVARFNPLSILDPASDHYADDIAYIADALIISQGKDPHWDDSARELVAGLIAYCVESFGDAASLPMVRLLLSKPAEEVAGVALDAQKLGHESVAARKLGRFAVNSKEVGSIVSTALTQTAFLDSVTLGESLSHSDFEIEDITRGPCSIFLVLPVDKLYTYGRWLRLLVSLGIRTVARTTNRIPFPVLFVLDEFGTIGRLSAVAQAFGLMAGLQMCLWAFVQDFVQLKRDYPDDWETFIGNCEALTSFGVMDQFTAAYISDMLGQATVERISAETAKIRSEGASMFSSPDPYYSKMTDQEFSRALMQPHEVRQLHERVGLMISREGNSRFLLEPYYTNPALYVRARPNPLFRKDMETHAAAVEEAKEKRVAALIPDYAAAKKFFKLSEGITLEESLILKKITYRNSKGEEKTTTKEKIVEIARKAAGMDYERAAKIIAGAT